MHCGKVTETNTQSNPQQSAIRSHPIIPLGWHRLKTASLIPLDRLRHRKRTQHKTLFVRINCRSGLGLLLGFRSAEGVMLQLGRLSSLQHNTELRMMGLPSPLKFWPSDMCICLSASKLLPETSRKQKQSSEDLLCGVWKNQMVWRLDKIKGYSAITNSKREHDWNLS